MYRKYWIENLPGIPEFPNSERDQQVGNLNPNSASCWLVEKGHFVEYLILPWIKYRIVALFFGPGEIMIRSHPRFSFIEALDNVAVAEFSHRDMFRTLKHFPEAAALYRASKLKYEEKVRRRLDFAWLYSDEERFKRLTDMEGWVLQTAPCEVVAGYLEVTPDRLRKLNHDFKY